MTCPYCQAAVEKDARTCASCRRVLGPSNVAPGGLIASRYRLLEELGAGGMGVVYKAHDRILDAVVALKILRSGAGVGTLRSRFISEIKLARSIRHRNVCAIHDGGEDGELLYISMELVDGRDLRRILGDSGPLDWEDGCDVAVQVALGLEAIHEAQVIHRDLKPANMLMDSKGVVRVMDFGIAKAWNAEVGPDHTKTGHIVGSPEYMSPEQVGGLALDLRSDLYSFGVVLFEIFTGRLPFVGDNLVEVMHKHLVEPPPLEGASRLPPRIVPILRRALAKDRDDRYGSATDMRRALEVARERLKQDMTPSLTGPPEGVSVRPRPDVARLLIPQLLRALGLPDPTVRRDAVVVLGTIDAGETVVPYLERARDEDDDRQVRDAATRALRLLPRGPRPAPREPGPGISSGSLPTQVGKAPPVPRPVPSPAPRPQAAAPVDRKAPDALPPPRAPRGRSRRLVHRVAIAATLAALLAAALDWLVHRTPAENHASPSPPGAVPPSPSEAPPPSPDDPAPMASTSAPPPTTLLAPPPTPAPRPPALHAAPVGQGTAAPGPVAAPTTVATTTLATLPATVPLAEPERLEPVPATPSTPPPTPAPPPVHAGDLVQLTDPGVRPPRAAAPLAAVPTPILERLALKGTVEMRVLVDEKGSVADQRTGRVTVLRKGGEALKAFSEREMKGFERILAEAARKTTTEWRFAPATHSGVPVRVWLPVLIEF